jgi:general stress protein CsbA
METFKKNAIWMIIFSLFIIIAAGHGIAFLGLIEIFGILSFNSGSEDFAISMSLESSYDKILGFVALLSLTGQLVLVISLFLKEQTRRFWIQILGLVILWIGFFYLTHNLFDDFGSMLGFCSGLPFLISSINFFVKIAKQKYQV